MLKVILYGEFQNREHILTLDITETIKDIKTSKNVMQLDLKWHSFYFTTIHS